ncbi:MAG: FAD:protein FMN transferase [Pirellula sp.]
MSPVLLEFSRDAMACRFEVLLHPGDPECGPEAAIRALDSISYLEQILSVYLHSSELSLVNARAASEPIRVSESCFELLQLGLAVFHRTAGAFDMTAAKLSKSWGFYRRQGKMPTNEEIQQSLQCVGSQFIELNVQDRTVVFKKPIEVNPGGIGKGFAIDCAATTLTNSGVRNFALHGGKSSLLCAGDQRAPDCSVGWRIAVRHPEQSERILGSLILRDQALGTSGPANQFFYFRGKRFGHIIDPRTGWPSEGMLSVTVLHPSAGWADALATGLYVMGIEKSIEYCEANPEVGMLAILPGDRDGRCEIVTCNIPDGQWLSAK